MPTQINLNCYPKYYNSYSIKSKSLPNGETIAYYQTGNKQKVVYFIHGIEGGIFNFHTMLPEAGDHFTSVFVDLRGHSLSSQVREAYNCSDFAEDIY
mmetsp:Transcript_32369/g.29186  ORF Transcript_32369/g.29186 Transcript_32369/m.29186 type:complete len:97 (-) Transcript_32369:409-699(-)